MAGYCLSRQAQAHEWFSGLTDPVTKYGCCNGGDCKAVPQDWVDKGAITPYFGGYHVKLTLEQARYFNSSMTHSVDVLVPAERVIWGAPVQWALCLTSADNSFSPTDHRRVRCIIGLGQS